MAAQREEEILFYQTIREVDQLCPKERIKKKRRELKLASFHVMNNASLCLYALLGTLQVWGHNYHIFPFLVLYEKYSIGVFICLHSILLKKYRTLALERGTLNIVSFLQYSQ